jgi:type IV pilus assembly protein PilM
MLSFVQSWFNPGANPIGVDFGSDGLRMAQVAVEDGEPKLVAAARADVPAHVRNDPAARIAFFADAARELWAQGNFRGRRAVLSLPAAVMTIQHLRMPKGDEESLKKSLPWECAGKLPYDATHALLRHLVAGEVFAEGEQRLEVVVMAAQREWVNQFLAAAARAKLDVVGMNVEPKALVDCFAHVYRRKTDNESTTLFVDIGCGGTRATIARNGQILFARSIPVGGDQLTRAVSAELRVGFEDAKILRIKQCHVQAAADLARAQQKEPNGQPPAPTSAARAGDAAGAGQATAVGAAASPDADRVEAACREPVERLAQELTLCRRYHESTFPAMPVDRLVFVGGEARHRWLCVSIARAMDLAAQVGDPMVRMARTTDVGPESGIDRRLPQPDWAVALGLTMGPVGAPVVAATK